MKESSEVIYGDNLTTLEISLRADLSGDEVVGTTINQKLTGTAGTNGLNVYQSNAGLLISDSASLSTTSKKALKESGSI